MRVKLVILAMVLVILGAAGVSWAADATATASVAMSATVNAKATLTIGSAVVAFADADPDAVPVITGTPSAIAVTCKVRGASGSTNTLQVQSSATNLTSGLNNIPVSNIALDLTGAGYSNITNLTTSNQQCGSWTTNGTKAGTLTFKLTNSWDYATGSYAGASAVFLLTATSP